MHIIAPARSISMLSRVIRAGADMIYTGLKGYCRKEKESIDMDTLAKFCEIGRENNVKVIVAFNKLPLVGSVGKFIRGIGESIKMGADGVILNDIGLISLVRNEFPNIYIMASIGMSPLNWREVNFIADSGADTVLLSEFLDIDEIREIREKCNAGLELFATGLREFGYTGKCILSSYHRQSYCDDMILGSAKRGGTCSNACRSKFRLSSKFPKEIKLRFQPFSILEKKLDPTGKTQFFHTEYKLKDLLPYIDIFKIWQGALSDDTLCEVIREVERI